MKRYTCKGYGKNIELDAISRIFKVKKRLSVVIATYNEEATIENLCLEIKKQINLTKFKDNYEIIVVDDSSSDKTSQIINKLAGNRNFIALHRNKDKGLFSAIVDGIKLANGDLVLTMDADFSHPPKIIPSILHNADHYDIVSGSRFVKGGCMEGPFLRRFGSKVLNRFCGFILGVKTKDLGGNFRLFDRDKFLDLNLQHDAIFGEFGFEIFYRAQKKNYKVKEIPFTYKFREEGKSKMGNLSKYGIAYLKRAFQLRFETTFSDS